MFSASLVLVHVLMLCLCVRCMSYYFVATVACLCVVPFDAVVVCLGF